MIGGIVVAGIGVGGIAGGGRPWPGRRDPVVEQRDARAAAGLGQGDRRGLRPCAGDDAIGTTPRGRIAGVGAELAVSASGSSDGGDQGRCGPGRRLPDGVPARMRDDAPAGRCGLRRRRFGLGLGFGRVVAPGLAQELAAFLRHQEMDHRPGGDDAADHLLDRLDPEHDLAARFATDAPCVRSPEQPRCCQAPAPTAACARPTGRGAPAGPRSCGGGSWRSSCPRVCSQPAAGGDKFSGYPTPRPPLGL